MRHKNIIYPKLNSALRYGLAHYNINGKGNVVLTEFPKSGGSWISQMLAEALDLPFPRNSLPVFGKQILHCHYSASSRIRKPLVLLRDGRDVAVSYYYHSLFKNDKYNGRLVERTLKKMKYSDPEDVLSNLPSFIEYLFSREMFPYYTWVDFTDGWIDEGVSFVKYEQFLDAPAETLIYAVELIDNSKLEIGKAEMIVNKNSFENMARRKPGSESSSSFMRKGIAGDWKSKFSIEAKKIFCHYAGDTLVRCGYEKDKSWVDFEYR